MLQPNARFRLIQTNWMNTPSFERCKNTEMGPSVMGTVLIYLGEEGKRLTVCVGEVHECQQNAGNDSKKSEPLGGSQQFLVHCNERRAIAVGLQSFFFTPNVHFSLLRDFFPQCDKFSNFVMEARRKWNSLYRNPFCSQLSWDASFPECNFLTQ